MLDFIFISGIILEILVTIYLCIKLNKAAHTVKLIEIELIEAFFSILEINKNLQTLLKKINKIISIFTNKKFITIKNIVVVSFRVIQVIVLIKSLDFSRGFIKSFNFKNLKKLFLARFALKFMLKILNKYCVT